MTPPSRTPEELRRDVEHLVADLFESDRCGTIPSIDIDRRDGELVVYARLPGSDPGALPLGLEVRLPRGAA
jgi:hypothetical protein